MAEGHPRTHAHLIACAECLAAKQARRVARWEYLLRQPGRAIRRKEEVQRLAEKLAHHPRAIPREDGTTPNHGD